MLFVRVLSLGFPVLEKFQKIIFFTRVLHFVCLYFWVDQFGVNNFRVKINIGFLSLWRVGINFNSILSWLFPHQQYKL